MLKKRANLCRFFQEQRAASGRPTDCGFYFSPILLTFQLDHSGLARSLLKILNETVNSGNKKSTAEVFLAPRRDEESTNFDVRWRQTFSKGF